MGLLHISISADDPERTAGFLAVIMGGEAMPFPPFPDSWIAFTAKDDGTAIEVYPATHILTAGPEQISCEVSEPDTSPTFVHAAISSVLDRAEILKLASHYGWTARICDRGPFECVEVWLENRLLVELLDQEMQKNYHAQMTASNWSRMFGLSR